MYNFFPRNVRDWNALAETVVQDSNADRFKMSTLQFFWCSWFCTLDADWFAAWWHVLCCLAHCFRTRNTTFAGAWFFSFGFRLSVGFRFQIVSPQTDALLWRVTTPEGTICRLHVAQLQVENWKKKERKRKYNHCIYCRFLFWACRWSVRALFARRNSWRIISSAYQYSTFLLWLSWPNPLGVSVWWAPVSFSGVG